VIRTLPLLVIALAAPGFDAQKSSAAAVESIPKAISVLVGDCSKAEFEDAIACEENVKKDQDALRKKPAYFYLGVPNEGLLRFEGMKGTKARFLWTPVHDARGLALTVGKPDKLDKSGRPVMKLFVVDVALADGVLESDVQRAIRTGNIAIELVADFDKTWALGAAESQVRGVSVKPRAIRFMNAKNGKPIGETVL
jgi:hypothetical protein